MCIHIALYHIIGKVTLGGIILWNSIWLGKPATIVNDKSNIRNIYV